MVFLWNRKKSVAKTPVEVEYMLAPDDNLVLREHNESCTIRFDRTLSCIHRGKLAAALTACNEGLGAAERWKDCEFWSLPFLRLKVQIFDQLGQPGLAAVYRAASEQYADDHPGVAKWDSPPCYQDL